MNRTLRALLPILLLSCEPPTFEPQSLVSSVRILAIGADQPYAAPGASVHLSLLAVDGRRDPPSPMKLYFLPEPCFNPAGDAYYACFPQFDRVFPRGVDLDAALLATTSFSFSMPENSIVERATSVVPYGVAVVFSIACAGHVQYRPPAPGGSPDAIPFACLDDSGRRLGADDFVFAYSLVYSFADRTNSNPIIESVSFGGVPVDPDVGISVAHCTKSKIDDCPPTALDVTVPSASVEPDPGDLDRDGAVLSEQIYVNYYVTGGKVANDAVILFDPREGRLKKTGNDFRPPLAPGEQRLWVVLRDNRGGLSSREFPLHVE
jgi:hypothetical protein